MNTNLTLPFLAVLILLAGLTMGFIGGAVGEGVRRLLPRRVQTRGRWILVVTTVAAMVAFYQTDMTARWGLGWIVLLTALALPSFIAAVLDAKPEIRALMLPAAGVFAIALFALLNR